jgi:hypothetical protein
MNVKAETMSRARRWARNVVGIGEPVEGSDPVSGFDGGPVY